MRLRPRSLLWRTFLLLAALVVLTTAAWFEIFRAYEIEPRARQVAQNMVSVVNLTRAALVTAQPEKRRELLQELAQREAIQVYPSEDGESIVALSDRPLLRLVSERVREELGQETRFASSREGLRGFWVTFRIDDDEYWVRVPRERLERPIAIQWLGWGTLALALSLLAAYFIVTRINRPLRALALAAAQIGKGRRPAPLPESGPDEIRTLSRAFNQMSSGLARLDEDRALILAGVSHDLRTPLARLRLGLEMSGGDEQMRQGMNADIEEMDRIIEQFLDFARADGGEAPELAQLSSLAAASADHHMKLGHALAADCNPTPPIPLKPKAMHRAISNLIDNALRYGGGEVKLTTREERGNSVLEVHDRGPGIPEGEAERLKQPFTRLEASRSGHSGSGLGLAIVDRIVRAHGGRFDLLARSGGGLTARIVLPLARGG
ncbi:MAG: HAMP domain-containing protein [Betaproteobacteria bacterium]|nr:HAMP domain-containing protein [Betaproteobacteria bacterium]